jgi:CRISPR-associated protein Csm2
MFEIKGWTLNNTNYHNRAEEVMRSLGRPDKYDPSKLRFELTTSKIRNLLTLVNQIYNDAVLCEGDVLDDKYLSRITYLNVRMVYEAGREQIVRTFLEKSNLLEILKKIGKSKSNFILFCRYFESLVAYHRFYGGQDK